METQLKIPFYARIALIFIGLFAFVYTMYIGQHIIIPLLYATIIAILLNPFVNFMVSKKINRGVAIVTAVVLATIVTLCLIYVISSQLSIFSDSYPQLKEKFHMTTKDLVKWFSDKFNIQRTSVTTWVNENQVDAMGRIDIGGTVSQAGRILLIGVLLPVYVYMILYYKPLLLKFIRKLFRKEDHGAVVEILNGTKSIVQSYLVGLFFEMLIVAVLNSAGLLLLGIQYAVILGIIGAVLNIIPYLGGIISTALPMIIALITKDSTTYAILVLLVYLVIQFIDNHFIIPHVVAKRVKINAMISVIVVLLGGALWGIPGMFLSIPLTAILKVIFDHIEPLKPWGYLLGNIVPSESRFSFIKSRK